MLRTIAALVVAGTFVSVDAFSAAPGLAARTGAPARASALAEHKLGLRRQAPMTCRTPVKERQGESARAGVWTPGRRARAFLGLAVRRRNCGAVRRSRTRRRSCSSWL